MAYKNLLSKEADTIQDEERTYVNFNSYDYEIPLPNASLFTIPEENTNDRPTSTNYIEMSTFGMSESKLI